MSQTHKSRGRAFTLVELLAVIGIIALLIGMLLPLLNSAHRSARDAKCKSNIRQVCIAFLNYASENKGKFPPNIDFLPSPPAPFGMWNSWYDVPRIGRYLPRTGKVQKGNYDEMDRVLGGVLVCPDDDNASASYAMNYWASSAVKRGDRVGPPGFPKAGKGWSSNVKNSTKLILVTEMLSVSPDGQGGYMCFGVHPTGMRQLSGDVQETRFYPGIAFVGIGRQIAYGDSTSRYRSIDTEFDWGRHRRPGDGGSSTVEARGRANFGFADGHVASFTADDVADRTTRRSKFVALWSPLDYYVDRLPRPNF